VNWTTAPGLCLAIGFVISGAEYFGTITRQQVICKQILDML